ncbi:hypothetical protein J2Z65_004128 [Paenibacillus aceris]|uniref:Uncharacterized protein n=1 Tax=Paenibacillus aceris TaxID=869555 RepID=A0ABS4I2E0_9BACL|nr:hypothetical protein [Paenibacillus aceris]
MSPPLVFGLVNILYPLQNLRVYCPRIILAMAARSIISNLLS